jgi:putative membrane protein
MSQKGYKKLIISLSIIIPIAVAILFKVKLEGFDLTFLPPIYASINGFTAIILILAIKAIKSKNIKLHERLIKLAMILSATFLLLYVAYHMTSESTSYGGEGIQKIIYLFILITHIILSIAVVPLVLFSFLYGITTNLDKHKKIVKFAFPLWLYVAVSGVVVYLMISPYYISNI